MEEAQTNCKRQSCSVNRSSFLSMSTVYMSVYMFVNDLIDGFHKACRQEHKLPIFKDSTKALCAQNKARGAAAKCVHD